MKHRRLFFRTPIGLAGIFLTVFGLLYLPFSGLGLLIALWMLSCGLLCLMLTIPVSRLKNTLLWQFVVIAICPGLMLSYMFVHEYFYTDSFIYLIPEGYRGKLTVKYRLPEGAPVRREGLKILMRFDKSGVLYSQYEGGKIIDHLNTEYYFVSPDGERTPIPDGLYTDTALVTIRQQQNYYAGDTGIWVFHVGEYPTEDE